MVQSVRGLLLLASALLALPAAGDAQVRSAPAGDSALSCATDLALLERKMHEDYACYTLELRGPRLVSFAAMKARAIVRAESATGDACFQVIDDFTRWFDDPHLFLYETTRLDTAESARRAATVERRVVDEDAARTYFRRRGAALDPIEGIWYDEGLRVAILPDSARGTAHFVAVVLTSDTSTWSTGGVRAHITRQGTNAYLFELSLRNHARVHRHARIFRHVLLRLSPGIWGREYPVAPADSGTLDPVDPHRPVLYRRDGTLVFAIPSHNGFKNVIDSLVLAHRDELSHADRLIIDLRGNEGGGSGMTEYLEPFVTLKDDLPDPFPSTDGVILSSVDQVAFARRGFGPDTSAFVRSLVERMTAHPGELVPVDDPAAPPTPEAPRDWVVTTGPRAVGVLVDRGTVSASEVFVLRALRSRRATVFGEPTAGALDYQTASIVPLSPRERRWYLGYGTITRSRDLPRGGMRGRGIPPQVRLDLARIADPVSWVNDALARRR